MAKGRRDLSLFLDSSVLFSAVNSPDGGSSKLFTLKNVKLHASKIVLHEVEKNVRAKLSGYHLDRFFMLVTHLTILEEDVKDSLVQKAVKVIAYKDAAILSSFKESECEYLITLDKKDFLEEKVFEYVLLKKVVTPKMFFHKYYIHL